MSKQENNKLPLFLKPFLWSYDFSNLDKTKNQKNIIKNILDYGTLSAIAWMKNNYSENEIKKVIRESTKTEWSKKSINFWSHIYGISPKKSRF